MIAVAILVVVSVVSALAVMIVDERSTRDHRLMRAFVETARWAPLTEAEFSELTGCSEKTAGRIGRSLESCGVLSSVPIGIVDGRVIVRYHPARGK